MTFQPLIVLSFISFALASPSNYNGTGISMLNVGGCPSCSDSRTLSDIIWACVATLFACTWTAIHPNIPGVSEGIIAITSRRLFIMGMALVAPELIITWAAQQFFSARKVANASLMHKELNIETKDTSASVSSTPQLANLNISGLSDPQVTVCKFKEWTVAHGFLACMGGFLLHIKDEPGVPLAPDELLRFVGEGSVDIPDITEADIEDRSRGDVLSKGIAILQLIWFVAQLVARAIQNLPITLLEVDTLAVAALTCIAYGWWWKKPKDVGHAYAVHWKVHASPPGSLRYARPDERLASGDCFGYFLHPFYSLMGWLIVSPRAVHSRRVPSLGGYFQTDDHATILLIGCVSGMLFAGIHFVSWNFLFQTDTEQILWRVASFAILGASASISISIGYEILQRHWDHLPAIHGSHVIMMISYFVYIVARFTLIVLVLLSFRALPSGVYDTVAWTRFFPHI